MAITKYESFYTKLSSVVEKIRNENEYKTDSIAFAHWYLENYFKLDTQEIGEAIIDGADDTGIDSVIIDEDNQALTIMQYKFPSKKENVNGEIAQGEILKTWNGFNTLIKNEMPYIGGNTKFADFKKQLEDAYITHFRIIFVSFNKGVIANREMLDRLSDSFKRDTGSELEILYHDRDSIINIYEKLNRTNNILIKLKYKQMQPAYNVQSRNIDSFVGFVNGKDLVKSIDSNIATIFDENIRLYEYGSSVNNGINRTATSTDQADMFYFYNNGIVFICDKASNSPASSEINLTSASVVNGCQTLTTLYNAVQNGKLNDEVYILVRIISITDYSERMRITEFLNSQTPIRDSYFISNHSIVRDLQKSLLEKGYFLERQINEYQYAMNYGQKIETKEVLELEKTFQYYVGYWVDKYASLAKRGKNTLFDKSKTEELLAGVDADKVIESYKMYSKISEVLTLYRKYRRNEHNSEFSRYIGVSQEWLKNNVNELRFMNTGDIILLNTYKNLKNRYSELKINVSENEIIVDGIFMIKAIFAEQSNPNFSLLTKSASSFSRIQGDIKALSGRVVKLL